MKLDPRQSEAFQAAASSGSFDSAASALHITPSALSQRIRALEESLGKPLLVRSRPCRPTREGQLLLQHLQRAALLEADLAASFAGSDAELLSIPLALNADSVASWFLPALAPFLIAKGILLELTVDDQDHTYSLLQAGLAVGCVSTEAQAMRGCSAVALGVMRYRAMAAPGYMQRHFAAGVTREALRRAPVLIYNRKDKLQDNWLQQHFGLAQSACPCHFLPASDPYLQAVRLGLGWGMLPEVQVAAHGGHEGLLDLLPQRPVDVALYWHSWKVQAPRLEQLSAALVAAAREVLLPLPA
ncbi:LysR family transcriptional regulator ArgP [Vogesella facilis]|uniref:LysR family transcriptional regulator ArgP n=1 Tax=Vogesella facilis TaxID=1655232 RepID=A0ABV7RDZ1_9NEIS